MPSSKRTPLTPLALEVLGLLHERPMHPYEMHQLMRQRRVDLRVKVKAGSLYHTVERLETSGDIEVVDTQREGRRPERTVYGLTDTGRDAYSDQVQDMLSTPTYEYLRFPVALSAANDIDKDDVLEALDIRVTNLEANIAAMTVMHDKVVAEGLPEMYWFDLDFRYRLQLTELEWTKQLVRRIRSGELRWDHNGGWQRSPSRLAAIGNPDTEADDIRESA